jgi:hypothetical protein
VQVERSVLQGRVFGNPVGGTKGVEPDPPVPRSTQTFPPLGGAPLPPVFVLEHVATFSPSP